MFILFYLRHVTERINRELANVCFTGGGTELKILDLDSTLSKIHFFLFLQPLFRLQILQITITYPKKSVAAIHHLFRVMADGPTVESIEVFWVEQVSSSPNFFFPVL